MPTHTRTDVADILRRAAEHVEAVGYTNWNRWDERQENAGTPRTQCSVDILGALAYAAHGDPADRISTHDDAANDARCFFARHFNSDVVPLDWDTTSDAANALRQAANAA